MPPPSPFTPGMISRYDQDMAALDEMLDKFVSRIREMVEKSGEPQATADMALMLNSYSTPGMNADLLLPALMRLARQR